MKVLFLAPGIPHAASHGGFIVVYRRMKMLAERGHEIGLAACVAPDDEIRTAPAELPLIEREIVSLPPRSAVASMVRELGHTIPPEFLEVRSEEMQKAVGDMVARTRYDVVIAEFSEMGQYLHRNPYLPATRRIVSCHTCHTTAAAKAQELEPWGPTRIKMMLSLKRLQGFEFSVYRSADHVVVMTPEEMMELRHYSPGLRISISPYGVDPVAAPAQATGPACHEDWIVFTGYFGHPANRDAALWFMREMWPALSKKYQQTSLYIVGRGATKEMHDAARRYKRVVVTGEVPDIAEYVRKAKIYVCPMRMGKGLRGKNLQAMILGIPVVSTTLGAEGISARSGHDIMLADNAHTMIENVSMLLDDAVMRRFIGRNGRRLASRYSWTHCVDLLEEVLYTVAV